MSVHETEFVVGHWVKIFVSEGRFLEGCRSGSGISGRRRRRNGSDGTRKGDVVRYGCRFMNNGILRRDRGGGSMSMRVRRLRTGLVSVENRNTFLHVIDGVLNRVHLSSQRSDVI